ASVTPWSVPAMPGTGDWADAPFAKSSTAANAAMVKTGWDRISPSLATATRALHGRGAVQLTMLSGPGSVCGEHHRVPAPLPRAAHVEAAHAALLEPALEHRGLSLRDTHEQPARRLRIVQRIEHGGLDRHGQFDRRGIVRTIPRQPARRHAGGGE